MATVVFPVPGPPVITLKLRFKEFFTAARCDGSILDKFLRCFSAAAGIEISTETLLGSSRHLPTTSTTMMITMLQLFSCDEKALPELVVKGPKLRPTLPKADVISKIR